MRLWRRWRKQRNCWHHIPGTQYGTVSLLRSQLIDLGRRKMWWCADCGRTWFS